MMIAANSSFGSGTGTSANSAGQFDVIETLEEAVIQSVRAAGIPQKAREISIIDKLMDLRRERRKIVSSLQQVPSVYEDIVQTKLMKYFSSIDELVEKQSKFSPRKREQQQNLLSALTVGGDKDGNFSGVSGIGRVSTSSLSSVSSIASNMSNADALRRSFQEKLDILENEIQKSTDYNIELKLIQVKDMIEKEKAMDEENYKQKIDQLRDKYEGKLALLEEKMVEVYSAKATSNEADVSSRIARMKETIESELIVRFNEKSRKYKDTIVDLEDTMNKSKVTINKLVSKLTETEDILKQNTERLHQRNGEIASYEKQLAMLRESNSKLSNEHALLRQQFDRNQESEKHDMEILRIEHQRELERVDHKIRQLMNNKDLTIKKLHTMFKESEGKRTDIEKMLVDLNTDLSGR